MNRIMITAPTSGGGKTAFTCALLRVLANRGLKTAAFKCGPDYIDPMLHRRAAGGKCRNLDLFLASPERVKSLFVQACGGVDAAVAEGVMGYYDGLGGVTDTASSWQTAAALDFPAVLVVNPKGAGLTMAAQIKGMLDFRRPSGIIGIILNNCTASQSKFYINLFESETGLPILGCLPHCDEAEIPSRHLGLQTAGEIDNLDKKLDILAESLESNTDIDDLLALCRRPDIPPETVKTVPTQARIAVARDEAFCFIYDETIDALRDAGAEIVYFSPIHSEKLPVGIGGLYLPGGYPELYAERLAANDGMRRQICQAVTNGLPTAAECGGFMYLCRSIENETGLSYPMAGVIDSVTVKKNRLVRFGYAYMTAKSDGLLFDKGDSVPIHEFHYWDASICGSDFDLVKPISKKSWQGGFNTPTLYAGFPHLYFAGEPTLAERFVSKAAEAMR